ncbi:hypothetical protein NA57DRAFT_77142 [Rhizodiscina lignyota]|uniref:Uncharacterized protein n=1 Tax=Rhizodiscina lignyota TaxID=1504668 RepID=A0A9P4M8H1_9PEZI|nr:hypothetical protein NA57DRAFT_77142 [Rhizodiscina lignyota]
MPSTQESGSHPRRPGFGRLPSSLSYVSQSPSDAASNGHSASYKASGQKAQKHVVGRLGRNVSFGKNLHKLTAQTAQDGDGADSRHHTRSNSGGVSAPSSPRPALMKRNTSTAVVKRNTSHTVLRKNLSSGHLPRNGSSKNVSKGAKLEAPAMKRAHSHPHGDKSQHQSPPPPKPSNPTVRFDVGEDEGQDDDWTEDSASQSPETTRSNTRNNSLAVDPKVTLDGTKESQQPHKRQASDPQVRFAQPATSPPTSAQHHSLSDSPIATRDYAADAHQVNGSSSCHPSSRPPDADMITARLLQRAPHNAAPPQTSSVSATVHADAHNPQSLSHSQGSTLNETPGKDLVSRFINGSGSSGNTPRDSNFLPTRMKNHVEGSDDESENDSIPKRNKSAPNMAHPLSAASSASHNRTASQPQAQNSAFVNPEMHPSRTQQKLWLQRASSAIEPQRMVPAILPRTAGPPLPSSQINYSSAVDSAGRLDPRLQRQFDQVHLEYKAIRRYRNPLAEAVRKLDRLDSVRRDWLVSGTPPLAPSSASMNGHREEAMTSARASGTTTPGTGAADRDRAEVGSRRSRVSFDVPSQNEDGEEQEEEDEEGSIESAGNTTIGSHRDDAHEICRRLWDMPAAGESG